MSVASLIAAEQLEAERTLKARSAEKKLSTESVPALQKKIQYLSFTVYELEKLKILKAQYLKELDDIMTNWEQNKISRLKPDQAYIDSARDSILYKLTCISSYYNGMLECSYGSSSTWVIRNCKEAVKKAEDALQAFIILAASKKHLSEEEQQHMSFKKKKLQFEINQNIRALARAEKDPIIIKIRNSELPKSEIESIIALETFLRKQERQEQNEQFDIYTHFEKQTIIRKILSISTKIKKCEAEICQRDNIHTLLEHDTISDTIRTKRNEESFEGTVYQKPLLFSKRIHEIYRPESMPISADSPYLSFRTLRGENSTKIVKIWQPKYVECFTDMNYEIQTRINARIVFSAVEFPLFPRWVVDASAGFGDGISFGVTNWIREGLDINNIVNRASDAYNAGLLAGILVPTRRLLWLYEVGREYRLGRNFRLAPVGNRTGDPLGEFPHYHRRVLTKENVTQSVEGQGIGRHRPWESSKHDKSFWDRF